MLSITSRESAIKGVLSLNENEILKHVEKLNDIDGY
jgi:hypothetical protein